MYAREMDRATHKRKAWLFAYDDGHATSAGRLFSMIASARLRSLDPET
jgi:transposase